MSNFTGSRGEKLNTRVLQRVLATAVVSVATTVGAFAQCVTSETVHSGEPGTFSDATDYAGTLILAGNFQSIDGVGATHIVGYSGGAFSILAGGSLNNACNDLTIDGSTLYAVGTFTQAGGNTARRVAAWNGATWSSLGTGTNNGIPSGSVRAVCVIGGNVYVGGTFANAGTVSSVGNIAYWNGSAWNKLGLGGTNGAVRDIIAFGADVIVIGDFTQAGGVSVDGVARFDGSNWSAFGSASSFRSLAVLGGELFAASASPARIGVQKWDGSAWIADCDLAQPEWCTRVYSDGTSLYAANEFGEIWKRVAVSKWASVGRPVELDGVNVVGLVGGLVTIGGNLYAASSIDDLNVPGGATFDVTRYSFSSGGLPTIDTQPSDMYVDLNGNLTLTVVPSAESGFVTFQWFKDGDEIPGATAAEYHRSPVATTDAGDYYVELTSVCGTTISDTATVSVRVPCVGDVNGDLEVGLSDLSMLLGSFGLCDGSSGFIAAADLNSTNCVDLTDLSMLLAVFGIDCP